MGTSSPAKPEYRARRPERTDLYRLLIDHLETSWPSDRMGPIPARVSAAGGQGGARELPRVRGLALGFARLCCGRCRKEKLLALSCHRRGICPSCHAKRLTLWSDELVERPLPDVAYRQWVITIPKRLWVFFRYDGTLFKGLSTLFVDILTDWMRTLLGRDDIRPAVVAAIRPSGPSSGSTPMNT